MRDSLPADFKKTDWEVFLFPATGKCVYLDKNSVDNVYQGFSNVDLKQQFTILNDALIRTFPSFFALRLRNREIVHFSRLFMNLQGSALYPGSINLQAKFTERNVFSYYHLPVPHWPLRINENLEFESMPINRRNYKRQAMAALKLAGKMIDLLKNNSLYDRATIVVLGDHGALAQKQHFLPNGSDKRDDTLSYPAGQGIPLLLIKPKHSHNGELAVSTEKVSLRDVKDIIESKHAFGLDTPRYFYGYNENRGNYFSEMTEYSIIGNSWDLGSWDGTGATYTNGLKSVRKINAIEYDKDYVFDRSIRD